MPLEKMSIEIMKDMVFTGERYIPAMQGAIELEHLNRYYFVVNQINLTGKIVLDIASGEGYGSNILAKYAQEVIGIDLSADAVNYSTKKYNTRNLKFIQGNAIKIPLKNDSVDVVVSFETLEHLDNHNEMMSEIKRVLKIEGFLVISSPDKYFYSDVPNYKNEFHVKELYYGEFQDLIRGYFKKTLFYSQRTFVGSMIVLDKEEYEYKKPIIINSEGNLSEFSPLYNIAIGTDNIDFIPNNQLVLFHKFNEILSNKDIEAAIKSVQNTKAFRLGKFFLKPLSFLKKKMT